MESAYSARRRRRLVVVGSCISGLLLLMVVWTLSTERLPEPAPPEWWSPEQEERLQKDVAIGILTTATYHHQVKQAALQSWWTEERRGMVTVFSDTRKPESAEIPNVYDTECGNTYVEGLWCKNVAMIEYWKHNEKFKDVKWFFRVMDDTYLHLENVLDLVAQYDHRDKILLGDLHCLPDGSTYPSGGPGILFSRGLLDDWNWNDWMKALVLIDRDKEMKDDVMWGMYLERRNISIINHFGITQSPLDAGGELTEYIMSFRNLPWALPFRPVAIHQQKRIHRMKALHKILHSIPYNTAANDKIIQLPPCECRRDHQKCSWNHELVDLEMCRWASQSLICYGPGPWPNFHHDHWHSEEMMA